MIIYKYGKDVFEPQKSAYTNQEATTKLSASETKILQFLIDNSGEIISREKLLEIGWPDKVVVPNSLNVAIANLRKAFKSKNEIIITIKGAGFTIANNTFIQQQFQPEVVVDNEQHNQEQLQSTDHNGDNNTVGSDANNTKQTSTAHSLPTMAKIGYGICLTAMFAWVMLWASSWQSPPCVTVNTQKICGNIELLNLQKLPQDLNGKSTVYIDTNGKMYEKI
ncbi:winged helix-turn-helix domain-containing protein [Photobacterium aquimaris]|uniref:Transcriptional regulator n=1 Tax=Photobacterium aquimaris TaxID=512643 RepID=A0A2T3HYC6_9GAMM|nr:winged helix-turn-helix domain-containing protein [Photobacterium aquimaris]MCP4954082.1 helix-turn-helix domain-containing protein [Photobacterium aquimaris]OBU22583.1 transcriptional regulator [Photobacterium aquimaris]PQJ41740.1 transcriptional regulator [Photobacterium aquimaris]PSU04925.1 transcriptional regulator [Photobacterium aquimaris]